MYNFKEKISDSEHLSFSVAKATLESLMSSEGVVMLNLRCGYIENGVVIFVRSFVTPFHQESSRSTLIINQLYSSIDFNHHSSFQL